MSISIDLNKPVLGPDDQPMDAPMTLGKLLSGQLLGNAKGNSLKLFDWGLSFYRGEPVSVDEADFKLLMTIVEESPQLTVLARGRLIRALEASKKG